MRQQWLPKKKKKRKKLKAICVFLPNCFLAGDSRAPWFPFSSSGVFSSCFSRPCSVITQSEKHLHPIRSSFGYIKLNTKGKKMFDGRVTLSSRKQSGNRHRVPGVSKLKNRLDPYFSHITEATYSVGIVKLLWIIFISWRSWCLWCHLAVLASFLVKITWWSSIVVSPSWEWGFVPTFWLL